MMFQPRKINESDLKNVDENKNISDASSMTNFLGLISTSNLKMLQKLGALKKQQKRLLKKLLLARLLSLYMSTID
jgi:hypothetical protein